MKAAGLLLSGTVAIFDLLASTHGVGCAEAPIRKLQNVKGDEIYIDTDSVRIENGFVRYWAKTIFREQQKDLPSILYKMDRTYWAVSCQQKSAAVTASLRYSSPGGGSVVWSIQVPREKWEFYEVAPGSSAANALEFVCDYIDQKKTTTGVPSARLPNR